MVKTVRHVGLVVRDPAKMVRFYRDRLGFSVYRDHFEKSDFVAAILDLPGVRVRTIKLKAANGPTLLELLYFKSHPSLPAKKRITNSGWTHLALTVRNLDDLSRRLKKAGVQFVAAPQVSPDGKAKVAFCLDPEKNFLELVQEL